MATRRSRLASRPGEGTRALIDNEKEETVEAFLIELTNPTGSMTLAPASFDQLSARMFIGSALRSW